MPFRFVDVCDLLERLDRINGRDPPFLPKDAEKECHKVVVGWFQTHRKKIDSEADGLALLSTLLPERRVDRVYKLQAKSLEKIVARVLALPNSRRVDLERWRFPGAGDLADCVERVQRQGETVLQSQANGVTVEEIDSILSTIASHIPFSSPEVRSLAVKGAKCDPTHLLGTVLMRLQAKQSKWLIRLVLKNFAPVVIPEWLVYTSYHNLLPILLKVHAELPAAFRILGELVSQAPQGTSEKLHVDMLRASGGVKPLIGTKIGRPPFFKARSINHVVEMAQGRRFSVEKKYDGEYCQVHIDLSKSRNEQIKIFSKSGKDSTRDRAKLHRVLKKCLELDQDSCKITRKCVLEGEVLVYSDKESTILDFHKIRKHVSRSGVFLGGENDSQAHEFEHLMVVFFDILVLDETPVLDLAHHKRMEILERLIYRIPGRAELVERQVICFSQSSAPAQLREAFARCISLRNEGLVLKPTDEPYFIYEEKCNFRSCCIKMKKSYIGEFGDVGDFAVVGASYDAVKAKTYGIPDLEWTDFYVGCLENKERVKRFKETPRFVVVATVSPNKEIVKSVFRHSKQSKSFVSEPSQAFELRVEKGVAGGNLPSTIFSEPFIFDMRCFGFDKGGGTRFWTMRFPQVSKAHFDRDYENAVGFSELQEMAQMERSTATDPSSQEDLHWIEQLEAADPRRVKVNRSTEETSEMGSVTSSPRDVPQAQKTGCKHFLIREDTTEIHDEVVQSPSTGRERHHQEPSNSKISDALFEPNDILDAYSRESPKRQKLSPVRGNLSKKRRRGTSLKTTSPQMLAKKSRRPLSDLTSNYTNVPTVVGISQSSLEPTNGRPCNDNDSLLDDHLVSTVHLSRAFSNGGPSSPPLQPLKEYKSLSRELGYFQLNKAQLAPKLTRPGSKHAGTGSCQRAGTRCILSRCVFTLAPCIAGMPWLTEDLLPSHGAIFTLDPMMWLKRPASLSHSREDEANQRKILLVESNRLEETVRISRKIEDLNLQLASGQKEWVEVYDWRLLEYVTKVERGENTNGYSWRRYWVGAV